MVGGMSIGMVVVDDQSTKTLACKNDVEISNGRLG
jgi:hypothetical protein